ncbi:hypothetical protein CASFOL_020715 [Castilleja foliolosa]|uniref:Pentatricopeptide repeat-containing protein n=1 Tax=Castilleja foliolosa TaxID=1961234 RepID=A0ABD3D2E3_9LAMI
MRFWHRHSNTFESTILQQFRQWLEILAGNAYCEVGNLDSAFELIEEMKENGVEPNLVTYTVVMKGLCKQHKLKESVSILKDMVAKGLYPDQTSYNALIQCSCKARDFNQAMQLYDEMVKLNVKPNTATHNILINGLCVYGELSDAERVFCFLQEENIELSKVAYTTLIKAVCVKGDVEKAKVLFREMVENGFETSVNDYSAVINRLCKRFLLDDAMIFFRMLLADGVFPDREICSVLMRAFEQSAMANTCLELTWLRYILHDLRVTNENPALLFCDNQSALHIAANPVFHERTKHIDIDCHIVREKLHAGLIKPSYVTTKLQLADIFTKALGKDQFVKLRDKLGLHNIHAPT